MLSIILFVSFKKSELFLTNCTRIYRKQDTDVYIGYVFSLKRYKSKQIHITEFYV
jgi:hypothetical protein